LARMQDLYDRRTTFGMERSLGCAGTGGFYPKTAGAQLNFETVATQPGDFGLIPIAEALKSTTSRTGGKPNVIARGPEPCSPGISRARSRIGPGSLATVSIVTDFCLALTSWCAGFAIKRPCQLVPATLAPAAHDPHANRRVHRSAARLPARFPICRAPTGERQEEISHGVGAS